MKQQVLNQIKADSVYSELALHIRDKLDVPKYLTPKEIVIKYLKYLERMRFSYKVIYKNSKSKIPIKIIIVKETLGSRNYDCVFCKKDMKFEKILKRRDYYIESKS